MLSPVSVISQMGEKMKKGQLCYLVSLCDAGAAGEGKHHQVVSPVDSPPYFCTTNNMQSAVVYLSQVRSVIVCGCFCADLMLIFCGCDLMIIVLVST